MKRSRTETDSQPSGLERLLNQLAADGIPIGPEEILRLRHAFRMEPYADRESLFNLLTCTLCKSQEQRRILGDDFDLWYEDAETFLKTTEDLNASTEGVGEPMHRSSEKKSRPGRTPDRPESSRTESEFVDETENDSRGIRQRIEQAPSWLYFCILWVFLIGIGVWVVHPEPKTPILSAENPPQIEKPISGTPSDGGFRPSPEYWTWRPVVEVLPGLESARRLDGLVSLTLLTFFAALIAGIRYYARVRKPKAIADFREGPTWTPLLAQLERPNCLPRPNMPRPPGISTSSYPKT